MAMTSQLSVVCKSSKFVDAEHLTILVNGEPLDQLLYTFYSNDYLLGLIPTIADWISLEEEANLVEIIYKSQDKLKIMPILMCPDDCDLYCTIIVAEVETTQDCILWRRIGLDRSNPRDVIDRKQYLGENIEWMAAIPMFSFEHKEYLALEQIYKRSDFRE
ncbi:hypothetical protein ACX93W_21805 [Paenibacillus sp. CAU 1782]